MTLPTATIRTSPEDFRVEEIPAYLPCGEGEHLFVTFEKRGWTTLRAVEQIARVLGVSPRDCGTAGLKDRHAVTVQTASFFLPLARSTPAPDELSCEGIRVLEIGRHRNKLRTGHLRGNRFELTLRDLSADALAAISDRLETIARDGLPNHYGSQRYGRENANATQALAWVRGNARPPKHPRIRRLQFSALQSLMFDELLDARVADDTWNTILPGDIVYSLPDVRPPSVESAPARPAQRDESIPVATGPMFGAKMPWPEGPTGELEKEILFKHLGDMSPLQRWAKLGEGARRPLKVVPSSLMVSAEEGASTGSLRVRFVLPKGAYATTVLQAACVLRDATQLRPEEYEQSAPGLLGGEDMEEETL